MIESEKTLYPEGMDLTWAATDGATLGKSLTFLDSVFPSVLGIIPPVPTEFFKCAVESAL